MVESVERVMKQVKEDGAILMPRVFRQITDNDDQAIVLAQVFYWFRLGKNGKPRARNIKWGELRFYKTHAEFGAEVGMTKWRVRDCLSALKEKGYITIEHHFAEGARTSFYGLNLPVVVEAIKQVMAAEDA
jgi:hypothetical protein